MRSKLTPLLVFAIAVATITGTLAVAFPSAAFDNLSTDSPIVVGHGTTIIEDNKVTTPELAVDDITPKTDNVIIENLTVGSIPGHGAAKHTDVTRELFIPALDDSDPNSTLAKLGDFLVVQCADTFDVVVAFAFKVPDDFVSFTNIKAVWSSPAASGNMFWTLNSHYGAAGEAYNAHGETPGAGELATGGANVINVQTSPTALTLADLAAGDYVGIKFDRRGSGFEDTLDADVSLLGLLFTYTAEQ